MTPRPNEPQASELLGEVPENVPVEYEDQAYVEGVRDLAVMIREAKSANWLAVSAVLDDCAGMIERLARARLPAAAVAAIEGEE